MSDNMKTDPNIRVTGNTPKGQKALFLVLICLVLVAGIVAAGFFTGIFRMEPKTPCEEIIAASQKLYEFTTIEASANINYYIMTDDPEMTAVNEILNNVTINLLEKIDQKENRFQLDLNLLYKGLNCGNLLLYFDMEKAAIQSQFLGQKTICFEWTDSAAVTSEFLDGMQIHLEDYLPILIDEDHGALQQIQTASYEIFAEQFGESIKTNPEKVNITLMEDGKEKTYACKEYLLNLNNATGSQEISQEYLLAILEHEAIRSLFKEKISEFIEVAKNNGDMDTWPVTEEEIRSFTDNLDEHWNVLTASIMDQFALMNADATETSQMESEFKLRIDKSGIYRNLNLDQSMQMVDEATGLPINIKAIVEMNLINLGKKLAFAEIDMNEAFNAGKASEAEWSTLGEEVTMNALGQIMINPLFQDIMKISGMGGMF